MSEEQPKTVEELISVQRAESIDLPDGDVGEGLRFRTNRGDFTLSCTARMMRTEP